MATDNSIRNSTWDWRGYYEYVPVPQTVITYPATTVAQAITGICPVNQKEDKMGVYLGLVALKPTEKEAEEGAIDKIVVELTAVVAKDAQSAKVSLVRLADAALPSERLTPWLIQLGN